MSAPIPVRKILEVLGQRRGRIAYPLVDHSGASDLLPLLPVEMVDDHDVDERWMGRRGDHQHAVIAYRRTYCRGRFSQPAPIPHKEG
jgi:hypothetical protein